jgi:hypothetical protein
MIDKSMLGQYDARHDRSKAESEGRCPTCEQVLWLSFYFDGFGFSDNEGPASNVVKLYTAAFERPKQGMRKFYYPGLGADFDPETGALVTALAEKASEAASEKIEEGGVDAAKDKAKKTAISTVKRSWERSGGIRDNSLPARLQWTLGKVWNEAKEAAGSTSRQVKRAVNKPRKQWARMQRHLRKEWQAYWAEVSSHPWRVAKETGKVVAKESAGYVSESIGLIRDSTLAAGLFNTGVDTRLGAARRSFQRAVLEAQKVLPVNKIRVAIFGYDMGGGLALAFSKKVLEDIAEDGCYEGIPVVVEFMGLFDCVTNRYEDNTLTGYMPLSNAVSSELLLLPDVKKCVHYAAAHELRFYKPLTMLGVDPADYRGPRQEMLFPGAQVDVGGGAVEVEEGIDDTLARLPLQMMYHRAYGAGIPMPSFEQLRQVDPKLHNSIVIPEEVSAFHQTYRNTLNKLVTVTREIPPLMLKLGLPVECGITPSEFQTAEQNARCTVPIQSLEITTLPDTVEAELGGHMVIYIHWLRIWFDQNQQRAQEREGSWGLSVPVDLDAYNRYEKLAAELKYLKRNARYGSQFTEEQATRQLNGEVQPDIFVNDPQAQALYWLWDNPGDLNAEIKMMYPQFLSSVHDSMAESNIEAAFGSFVYAKHYMNRRPIQKLSTAPDPGILDKLNLVYERIFDVQPEQGSASQ